MCVCWVKGPGWVMMLQTQAETVEHQDGVWRLERFEDGQESSIWPPQTRNYFNGKNAVILPGCTGGEQMFGRWK